MESPHSTNSSPTRANGHAAPFNIGDAIFSRANPFTPAVIDGKTEISYQELDEASARVADRLKASFGDRRALRVGLHHRDCAKYIVLALGILRAGSCFVPVPPELTRTEQERLSSQISLDFLIQENQCSGDFLDFEVLDPGNDHKPAWADSLAGLNPAFIRFSSGTTGQSKGIVLSHETLRERVEAANAGLKIAPEDKILWVLAMSHHFAVSIILYLWHGAAVVLPESHLAADILEAAVSHRATVLYAAPFHYELLAGDSGKSKWPSLRLAVSTTAALPLETGSAFDKAFGLFPSQALGIIEVGLPCLNVHEAREKPASVGPVQPAFDFELRTPQGKVVGPLDQGELFLKGPGMFDAYVEPWQLRSEVLKEGWFSTGDIAQADSNGCLYLVGRSGSAISVGGMKFFPEEVEVVLCQHPKIAEARVFGRPHPTFGMIPSAELVTTKGETPPPTKEIIAFCRTQIARYMIPVEITFVDTITRTASGKIKRT